MARFERKQTEIAIEEKEKLKRIVQAEGIARSIRRAGLGGVLPGPR